MEIDKEGAEKFINADFADYDVNEKFRKDAHVAGIRKQPDVSSSALARYKYNNYLLFS